MHDRARLSAIDARFRRGHSPLRDFSGRIRSTALCGDLAGVMQVGLIKALREPDFLDKCLSPHDVVHILRAGRFGVMLRARKVVRDMPVGLLVVGQTRT